MQDPLKLYVPEFKQEFLEDGELYIQMQDLLEEFCSPSSVMDCKMGIRYYQQNKTSELHLRKTYWTPLLGVHLSICLSIHLRFKMSDLAHLFSFLFLDGYKVRKVTKFDFLRKFELGNQGPKVPKVPSKRGLWGFDKIPINACVFVFFNLI